MRLLLQRPSAPRTVLLFLLITAPLHAQVPGETPELRETLLDHWRWVHFDSDDGLPDGRVYALAETRGGVPWVSTSLGPALFDGYRWRPVEGLPERVVNSIAPGAGEDMWLLVGKTIHVVDGVTGAPLARYDAGTLKGPRALVTCGEGTVRLVGKLDGESFVFDPVDGSLLRVPVRPAFATGVLRGTADAPEHTLHGAGGLLGLAGDQWVVRPGVPDDVVVWRGVADIEHGRGVAYVFAPYERRGIWEWGPDGSFQNVLSIGERGLALDLHASGAAVAVVESGRILTRARDGTWEVLPTIPEPLSGVRDLRFRRNGDLWSVTAHGLYLLRVGSNPWRHRLEGFSPTGGVTTMDLRRASNGDLWIGNGRGARQLRADGESVHHVEADGVQFIDVTTIAEGPDGRIWIGSGSASFPGAYVWDGARWTPFGAREGLTAAAVHRIYRDHRGRLWFLALPTANVGVAQSTGGIFVLEDGVVRRVQEPARHDPAMPMRYYDVAEGENGEIWIATLRGVWCYDANLTPKRSVSGLRDERVFCLRSGPDGRMWLAHQDGAPGIAWIDSGDVARYLPVEEGFSDPHVFEFEFDDEGTIWAACSTGLFAYAEGTWNLCPADITGAWGGMMAVLPETEHLFAGGVGTGTAVLDRKRIGDHPPRVELREVVLENDSALVRWSCASWWGAVPGDAIATRYRIGDEPWSGWSKRRSVRRELPPGTHRIEVEALPAYGGEQRARAAGLIELPRPLHRSPAFVVPLAVLGSLVLGLGLLLAQRKRRESESLRESEARLRQLTENMGEVIWLTDWRRKKLLYVSPSYDAVWGRSSQELLAGRAHWGDGIHPDDRDEMLRRHSEHASHGEFDEEYRIIRPDGEVRWLRDRVYPIRDADGEVYRVAGLTQDVTAHREADERQALLARELDHRVKNTLAGVLALTEQTARMANGPKEFERTIAGRIRAMARAHEALAAGRWEGVPVADLVQGIVQPYATGAGQVRVTGAVTVLPPHISTPVCMALHELTTNAAKYGALSDPAGHVEITWSTNAGELELIWRERGGPGWNGVPPESGFGMSLVRGVAEHELHGSAEFELEPEGLVWRLRASLTGTA